MKLVIGLGNPGEKYKNNRHNVGFLVVEALHKKMAKSELLMSNQIRILKSLKFMNQSGLFVSGLVHHSSFEISNLYIIHDDLDIPLGSFKIQFGKGPKEHNGLISIYDALGTKEFWHIRVGIENRQQALGTRVKGEQYVLEDFTKDEMGKIEQVVKQIAEDLCKKLEV